MIPALIHKIFEEIGKEVLKHKAEEGGRELAERIKSTHQLTIRNSKDFDIFCATYVYPGDTSSGWHLIPSKESINLAYESLGGVGAVCGLYVCSSDGTFSPDGTFSGTFSWDGMFSLGSFITHYIWVGYPRWGLGGDVKFSIEKPMIQYFGTSIKPFEYSDSRLEEGSGDGISGAMKVLPHLRRIKGDYTWTVD
jgi:hypothetical protein